MPTEIRAMREQGQVIKSLTKQLEEKEEVIATLQGQMEMMRKQVIMMKTTLGRKLTASNLDLGIKQDIETQTTPTLANGRQYSRSPSTSSSRGSRKRKRCVIC